MATSRIRATTVNLLWIALLLVASGGCGRFLVTQRASWDEQMAAGRLAYREGRHRDAERWFRHALTEAERRAPEDISVAISLSHLAGVYHAESRYSEAEGLFLRALAIEEKTNGPESARIANTLMSLGHLYQKQRRYAESELALLRALTVAEKTLGPESPQYLLALDLLGLLYFGQGKYAEAEPFYRRALSIQEAKLGPEHPKIARHLTTLAAIYHQLGRYAEAESLYRRAVAIKETPREPEDVGALILAFNALGEVYRVQGRYAEAQSTYLRALTIQEKALSSHQDLLAETLQNLGLLFITLGHHDEAEPLLRRALAIWEKVLGSEHALVGQSLRHLAMVYGLQLKDAEAERLYWRALALVEKTLGVDHPEVAHVLSNLASFYMVRGKYAHAEPLAKRALAIQEMLLGPEHPALASSFYGLGVLYGEQGKFPEAEPLLRRALSIREKVLGPNNPGIFWDVTALAETLGGRGQYAVARALYERARRLQLLARKLQADLHDDAHSRLFTPTRWALRSYVALLAAIARDPTLDPTVVTPAGDAFVVAEHVRHGVAQLALARAGARLAASDPAAAQLAHEVEELKRRRQALQTLFIDEHAKPTGERDAGRMERLQTTVQELERHLSTAIDRLYRALPTYAELVAGEPIDVAGVQRLLRPDEALVSFLVLDDRVLSWLVRPDRAPIYRDSKIKSADLFDKVVSVRLTADQRWNPLLATRRKLWFFDVVRAHDLYQLLLGPLEEALAGIRHLIIVPDDELLQLPFGALITRADGETYWKLATIVHEERFPTPEEVMEYRKLPWLVRNYAVTVLPSATALRALRQIRRVSQGAREPLIGFGDPVLDGWAQVRGGSMLATRGATVSVADLRRLGNLPGTKDELMAVARALGADPATSLYTGELATKPVVLELNASGRLSRARVLAFATHALIAGELKGVRQPALVLTPPATPTEHNDGLLNLDDILGLKLDSAEWVILSACNTAAPERSGEGLSGLVRAFFFAGARSLLVSHWSVDDQATQALMMEIFRRYAATPALARAEAVRQGMLALMDDAKGDTAYFAHPFAWAAFFLVGEGLTKLH